MYCLTNINHYSIPNDIVVTLSKIYRFIGNNDFYIKTLGNDISKVIEMTVEKDAYYLGKILKVDISEARSKLIVSKDSSPRNKEESTLYNIKDLLGSIQQKYQKLTLQSNDLHNALNYVYSSYHPIKFSLTEGGRSVLASQGHKSKRLVLDEMNEMMKKIISSESFEHILLNLHYFIDISNLKPFDSHNETLSLLVLYQLILSADLNCFKYVSFFQLLYNDYEAFLDELCKASVNWKEGLSQTTEFVRFFLNIILKAYENADAIINNYLFDKANKKHENIESTILNMKSTFTKDQIRLMHPYVSESTINRALTALRNDGLIKPLGKGRSAKWMIIKKRY